MIYSICTSTCILLTSAKQNHTEDLEITDESYEFRDFYHFRKYTDSAYVESSKTNSSIEFDYYPANKTRDYQNEIYVFLMSDFGSCTNFKISLDINGNFTTGFGDLRLRLGHYEQNTIERDVEVYLHNNGRITTSGYINYYYKDDEGNRNWESGTEFNSKDRLTLTLERMTGKLVINIEEETRGTILHLEANKYIYQPYHYFLIEFDHESFSDNPNYTFLLNDPVLNIVVDGEPIENNPFFSSNLLEILLPIGIGFVIIILVVVFLIQRRRRITRHIREDPTLYNRREPLSEDFLESIVTPEMSEVIAKRVHSTVGDKFIPHPMIYDGKLEDSTCMICRAAVNKGDEIFQCPHCEHIFHKDHFIKWVSTKHKCPICKEVLIKKDERKK